jgi:hypothetical protein
MQIINPSLVALFWEVSHYRLESMWFGFKTNNTFIYDRSGDISAVHRPVFLSY